MGYQQASPYFLPMFIAKRRVPVPKLLKYVYFFLTRSCNQSGSCCLQGTDLMPSTAHPLLDVPCCPHSPFYSTQYPFWNKLYHADPVPEQLTYARMVPTANRVATRLLKRPACAQPPLHCLPPRRTTACGTHPAQGWSFQRRDGPK